MVTLLQKYIVAASLLLVSSSCTSDTGRIRPFLRDGVADLAIVYKADATDEQIEAFCRTVLAHTRDDGSYEWMPVIGLYSRTSTKTRKVSLIVFQEGASNEQRAEVKKAVLASAVVDRVLEGATASQLRQME